MIGIPALTDLWKKYKDCEKCPALVKARSHVILGSGSASADLMIIGEAPAVSEDEQGTPFVGESGRRLMELIALAWPDTDPEIQRILNIPEGKGDDPHDKFFRELRDYLDEHLFWTNVVCCWPGEGRKRPTTAEKKACRDRLHRTIYAVDPALIITLGKEATAELLHKKIGILHNRGTIYEVEIQSPVTNRAVKYPTMALLHPGFLIGKGDEKLVSRGEGYTYDTIQDLRYAFTLLNEMYSEHYDEHFPHRPEKL